MTPTITWTSPTEGMAVVPRPGRKPRAVAFILRQRGKRWLAAARVGHEVVWTSSPSTKEGAKRLAERWLTSPAARKRL